MTRLPLLAAALSLVACQQPTTWNHDVKPIVDGRCVGCHSEGGVGPFPLTDFRYARPRADLIAAMVDSREMPPWHASASDIEFRDNPSLTQEQIDTIVAWANDGAHEGDAEEVTPLPPVGQSLSREDLVARVPRPYVPTAQPDEYRCFPIDWTETKTRYLTGFEAVPKNKKIVHHVALYLITPDHAELPDQWDAEDVTDGYSCYGGPAGNRPVNFPIVLLGGWAPGGRATILPEGLGLKIEPGSKLVLQMHFNAPNGESDQTELRMTLEDSVAKPAYFIPFLNLDWAVFGNMPIPAGESAAEHVYVDNPRNLFSLLADGVDLSQGFDMWSVGPHMHQLGKRTRNSILRVDHTRSTLIQIDDWDFHWQHDYLFQEPVSFGRDDRLELRCTWDNSADNQPVFEGIKREPHDVNWGEGTGDEMCETTILITPHDPL